MSSSTQSFTRLLRVRAPVPWREVLPALVWAGGLAVACGGGRGADDDPLDESLVRAEALADSVEQAALVAHLQDLEALAIANVEQPGVRPREATRVWAIQQLEAAGYQVTEQHFAALDPRCGDPCAGVNVVAEWPDAPPGLAVLVAAHYDVVNGPGINDNGTGVATVIEIAKQAAALGVVDEVSLRFALFDREETGSPYGAKAYLSGLSLVPGAPGPGPVVWELLGAVNVDMTGSLNGVPARVVYAEPAGSMAVAGALESRFAHYGSSMVTWPIEDLHAQGYYLDSDAFAAMRVPVSTLFSGGRAIKPAEHAGAYGGTAGEPYCACYHAPCDGLQNVDPARMTELARAAAWAAGQLGGRSRLGE
jgi:aminopeptidase S